MTRITRRISGVALALALVGCSKSEPAQPAQSTPPAQTGAATAQKRKDPEAARKLIAEGAVVLDVRSTDEYAEAHLPSAAHIPVDDLATRIAEIEKLVGGDKGKPVVVYCASGKRAATAKAQLEAAGYSNVVNGGGLDDLR